MHGRRAGCPIPAPPQDLRRSCHRSPRVGIGRRSAALALRPGRRRPGGLPGGLDVGRSEQGDVGEQAEELSDQELSEHLLPLRGVGRWTIEMLLIFTLARLDVMPVDDFGIRSGLQHLVGLDSPPRKRDFSELTDHWAPYRSVAAWYLWRLADARKSGV